mgnify:CR=1 FL=1
MKHLYKEYSLENWCISTCALNNKGSYLFMGSATLAQKDGSTFHQGFLAPLKAAMGAGAGDDSVLASLQIDERLGAKRPTRRDGGGD